MSTRADPKVASAALRRRKAARFTRFAGVALCVLLVVTWWVASRWYISWRVVPSLGISLFGSAVHVSVYDMVLVQRYAPPTVSPSPKRFEAFRSLYGSWRTDYWLTDYAQWGNPPASRSVVIPVWMLLTATLIPTGLLWRAELRARRERALAGRCRACGYDRAGLTTSAACPECGAVPGLTSESRPS